MAQNTKRVPLLSTEGSLGLALAIYLRVAEVTWDIRAVLVLIASLLIFDAVRRLNRGPLVKSAAFLAAETLLINGSWRKIWDGFHESFPYATTEDVLFHAIIIGSLLSCCAGAYAFIIRPWGKEGYRVLPAQVIAFGATVIGIGFFTLLVGLAWQFQQNWASGRTPTGAPIFTVGPPRITQTPQAALPSPRARQTQNQLFVGYDLTASGVTTLAKELFSIRDKINHRIELLRMATDRPSLVANLIRACDLANIDCPENVAHPNSPDEKGIMLYVADPDKPPAAAEIVKTVFQTIGLDIPFVKRVTEGPDHFSLFIGRAP